MKVLMVMQHANLFRNLDTVVRELDARHHEIVMLHGTRVDDPRTMRRIARKRLTMVFMGRGIELAEAEIPSVTTGYRPEPAPEERWHAKLRTGRLVMNRSIYFRNTHPSPPRSIGPEKELSERIRRGIGSRIGRAVLRTKLALRAWRGVERVSSPSETVVSLLKELQPDVVLVSPMVWPKRPVEADYVHAAKRLGIPTVGYLNSWDNLTSKGTVHVVPDIFILWNEALAKEAEEIHDVPRKVLRVTGAPHFDYFFQMRPGASRATICKRLGCPDEGPYIVYLCSSRTLISDETHVVTELAGALARQFEGAPPTIVVRPHPVNPKPWADFEHPGVRVYPNHGDQADTPDAWQEYFDQLITASCCVGLNTTAFLEALVADRPCLTLVSDEFHDAQGRTGHFRHLRDGDFLEVSSDMAEVASRVASVLAGADTKAEARRRFAASFLRPRGIETRAAVVVAETIESMVPDQAATADARTAIADPPPASLATKEGRA